MTSLRRAARRFGVALGLALPALILACSDSAHPLSPRWLRPSLDAGGTQLAQTTLGVNGGMGEATASIEDLGRRAVVVRRSGSIQLQYNAPHGPGTKQIGPAGIDIGPYWSCLGDVNVHFDGNNLDLEPGCGHDGGSTADLVDTVVVSGPGHVSRHNHTGDTEFCMQDGSPVVCTTFSGQQTVTITSLHIPLTMYGPTGLLKQDMSYWFEAQ